MRNKKLSIGWVDYWNLLPMRIELERLWRQEMHLVLGTPRQINKKLLSRAIDLSPSSSVCLLSSVNLEMVLPLGVFSNGAVRSVYLGFQKRDVELVKLIEARNDTLSQQCQNTVASFGHNYRELARYIYNEAKTNTLAIPPPAFKLSPHSASSNALLHIFYLLWFGADNYEHFISHPRTTDHYTGHLQIGDEALLNTKMYHYKLDLGEIWKKITGLPFVYSVWQAHSPLERLWRQRLLSAAELATTKMRVDPNSYLPEAGKGAENIDLINYWQGIFYQLKEKEFNGLYLFLNMYRLLPNVGIDLQNNANSSKFMRWESIADRIKESEVNLEL